MADRHLAAQAAQLLLGEDLRDEAHVAKHGQALAVGHRDAGRLLSAVLEREEGEVGEAGDVALGRVDPEDAAHQSATPASYASRRVGELGAEQAGAADVPRRRYGIPSRIDSSRAGT